MQIQWLGTAGFRIKTHNTVILLDPYLTRNPGARPVQNLKPADLGPADHIFVSHGHFDHIKDIPEIAGQTHAAVYCSDTAGRTLASSGISKNRLHRIREDGWEMASRDFTARAGFSRHVRFDTRLLIKTLLKANLGLPGIVRAAKPFPCGQTLNWQFSIEGKRLLFFGSAGATARELERLARDPLDILLVPLQGHSDICRIAAGYVRILSPRTVIPHHHDDFYPPLSQAMNLAPFLERVARECPGTAVRVMEINRVMDL